MVLRHGQGQMLYPLLISPRNSRIIIERMRQGNRGVYPLQHRIGRVQGIEKTAMQVQGGVWPHRHHGGNPAGSVPLSVCLHRWLLSSFKEETGPFLPGYGYGCSKSVGTGSNHHSIIFLMELVRRPVSPADNSDVMR